MFAEPCCGNGALVHHLELHGLTLRLCRRHLRLVRTPWRSSSTAMPETRSSPTHRTIRPLMHALIEHFTRSLPAWLLLEMDWASTQQAGPFMPSCTDIVSIGRLRWIEGTTMSGKQNFAWYRFDHRHLAGPIFHAHGSVSVSSRVSLCAQCGAPPDRPAAIRFQVLWRMLAGSVLTARD